MFPVGSFESMESEIRNHEISNIPVTIGLLIVDYRQTVNREYILNYLNRFDYKSDKYINFYLPGYLKEKFSKTDCIRIKDKTFYFCDWIYESFLKNIEEMYEIDYPYTPELILIEYDRGMLKPNKKIIIELDNDNSNIKKTGELFEKIFSIAKECVSMDDFSNKLINYEFKNSIFDTILSAIDNSYISSLATTLKGIRKYKIK